MEDFFGAEAPYALAHLAGRTVPIPRDNERQYSLYTLCRAWVRNNPALPLTADSTSPLQQLLPGSGNGTQGLDGGLSKEQGGLISILPKPSEPTILEKETTPPTYPLDDFERQEPEEALRKLREHWIAVRQYHQALRRAKLSRHRERMQLLLGEPSVLNQHSAQMGLASALSNGVGMSGLSGLSPAFLSSGLSPGLMSGASGSSASGSGHASAEVLLRMQDPATQQALANLAALVNLGGMQAAGGGADAAAAAAAAAAHAQAQAQGQQVPLGQPLQIGSAEGAGVLSAPLANGAGAAGAAGQPQALGMAGMDVLFALQQQLGQVPQGAGGLQVQAQAQQPQAGVVGDLSAAVAAAAAGPAAEPAAGQTGAGEGGGGTTAMEVDDEAVVEVTVS
ncbi:hypothetical protein HYH03_009002 [Edaphochlamys debaryana]|uniref:Uncharacterized protein n=1 Tax=Edaphochlamys debaryana TaxID=47281 RepID=A0A835Y1B4_9CHLO|nr:hypothetical protein HYH03_009002 [Edaphochlamys debaryana]|eukprot:KAG2492848.1 hypothetical protein HYH03_009002 [Edaphochlamys debaryana]